MLENHLCFTKMQIDNQRIRFSCNLFQLCSLLNLLKIYELSLKHKMCEHDALNAAILNTMKKKFI